MNLRCRALLLCGLVLFLAIAPGRAVAEAAPLPNLNASACADGVQSSGAQYRICLPTAVPWNGDLLVFAHGYVPADAPVAIPEEQLELPDGTYLPDLVTDLGYAFAMSSYRLNGLAIKEGLDDTAEVVQIFADLHGTPAHVFLAGVSEGGLIAALAAERRPDVFSGALATCGPVGDFRRQVNYFGDVRVLFDYFFPGVLPGSAVSVPQEVMDNWETVYRPAVQAALLGNPLNTAQLLSTARVPFNPADPATGVDAILQALWYNVFATNDSVAKLGGQPFDNATRRYRGSLNDSQLNATVARFTADPAALAEIAAFYQTSGLLAMPVVTLHTLGDPVVPYWHEPAYRWKVFASGASALHHNVPSPAFGHCQFTTAEVTAAFAILVMQVTGQPLQRADTVLVNAADRERYRRLVEAWR